MNSKNIFSELFILDIGIPSGIHLIVISFFPLPYNFDLSQRCDAHTRPLN